MRALTFHPTGAISSLTLFISVGANLAHALDLKTFSGVFCQTSGSSQSSHYSRKELIAKRTSRTRCPICPIVRDNTSDDMIGLRVTVRDRHPTRSFPCVLNSVSRDGSGGWPQTRSTGAAFQGFQTLSFNGIDQAPGGTYTLVCQLPAMLANVPSYLSSYQLIAP